MSLPFFISLLFCLQFFYWWVGRRHARLQNGADFFLAGKGVGLLPLTMTFVATQVGGGLVLGAAEEAYLYGWSVLCYPAGVALGLLLLGSGIGRRLGQFSVSTVAEIFELVYGSATLKRIASLLSIISLFMILVAQIIASQKFLQSLGLSDPLLFIAFWAIVILYTAGGGLKGIIATDTLQAFFFSLLFATCALIAYKGHGQFLISGKESFAISASSKMGGWLVMPMLFMAIEQDMAQRCFAAKSPRMVSKASLLAAAITLGVGVIPVFFGVLGRGLNLNVAPGSSVLMGVVEATTNPWISAAVGCAVLAAVISTAGSLITAISSHLVTDFKRVESLWVKKIAVAAVAIAAISFAFAFDSIVGLLIQSYELSLSALLVPTLMALFKRDGNKLSAGLSMLFGATAFVAVKWMPPLFLSELLPIACSGCGFALGIKRGKREEYSAQ